MKFKLLSILGVAGIAVASLSSCETDACADVECGDNGTCLEGECVCDPGYEGSACDSISRLKFLGTYDVEEDCGGNSDNYEIEADESSMGIAYVRISNFYDVFSNSVVASVELNSLTIADQEPDNDDFWVSGNGTYDSGKITMSYTVTDSTETPPVVVTCTATMDKL